MFFAVLLISYVSRDSPSEGNVFLAIRCLKNVVTYPVSLSEKRFLRVRAGLGLGELGGGVRL